ncbi:signal peptidase I [Listeria booriae]|uniref:signal peptidase I n=1 Tax=Listeria booriae TaxID=1552123 RepID=UPI0016235F2B|nr:signal peptidase I [Listeria booriae]MBC2035576.1 signal peptidase I [Listeria booriae]
MDSETNDTKKTGRGKGKAIWGWVQVILIAVILSMALRYFVISPVTVFGDSMYPTLHDGEHLFINKVTGPDRFDIIVFPAPDEKDTEYIKRVIGLPGDTVEYKQDQLYINGKKYDEPYLDSEKKDLTNGYLTTLNDGAQGNPNFSLATIPACGGATKVPKGKLFVLGDNRPISKDSRYIGFIDEDKVLGKVISFGKSLQK